MVFLSGVRIGNISEIKFRSDSDDLDVILDVDRKFQNRITEGSVASVRTLGALGDKFIYVEPGPRSAPALKNGGRLQSSDSEDFLDILAKKGDDLANITEVITEMNVLLKSLNQNGRSSALMENMVQSSQELNALLKESKLAVSHLTRIAEKVDNGDGTLGALINDPTLHQKLSSLLGDSPRKTYLKSAIRESIRSREHKSSE